jgi:hypothetical protein
MRTESYPTAQHNTPGVPEALKAQAAWMGTIFERRADGRVNKPPYRIRSGERPRKAAKTDPANWTTFEDAAAALEAGEVDAIGVVLTEADPHYVCDLDSVIDAGTGEIHPTAAEIIHTLATYSERSVSGEGVHVLGEGDKPEYAKTTSNELGIKVELYTTSAFIVITGDRLAGTPSEPQPRQDELDELCKKLWPPREKFERRADHMLPLDLTDEELLTRARRSKTGKHFRSLFDYGQVDGHTSHSEADFDLIRHLIFWTAGDAERIERLFCASALYREQKARDYVARSVRKGLASYSGKFYRPRTLTKTRSAEKPDPLTPYLQLLLDPSAWTGRKAASAYKAYCAAVILADEVGVVDDDGNLRIGSDIRRLAEVAGTSAATLSRSALPHLMQEMNLLRWRRGKGRSAGVFVLPTPKNRTDNTRVLHNFSVISLAASENDLQTLRLLIRMRGGQAKHSPVVRLGMAAMFTAVALAGAPSSGVSLQTLAERTGRRKSRLAQALQKLKAAGVARERAGLYALAPQYAREYERSLRETGITYAERDQRRRHAADRARRNRKIPVDKQRNQAPLRGKKHMHRVVSDMRRRERERTSLHERPLSVEDVGCELRRGRSGPCLALKHYLAEPSKQSFRWLVNAVLRARGRPLTQADASLRVVKQAAADPRNHPATCECRRCAA